VADGELRLVGLQVPDEFPAHCGLRTGTLFHGFLDAILTDTPETVARGIFDRGGRSGLGDRHQFDLTRLPASRRTCLGDPGPDGVSPADEFIVRYQHGSE